MERTLIGSQHRGGAGAAFGEFHGDFGIGGRRGATNSSTQDDRTAVLGRQGRVASRQTRAFENAEKLLD